MNRLIDKLFHVIDCFTGILTGLMAVSYTHLTLPTIA